MLVLPHASSSQITRKVFCSIGFPTAKAGSWSSYIPTLLDPVSVATDVAGDAVFAISAGGDGVGLDKHKIARYSSRTDNIGVKKDKRI